MKQVLKKTEERKDTARLDENAVCDVCGAFGAFHFGDRLLGQDCYEGCGSCCPEFGKDDLWQFPDQD
jgi:hypothetical protein